MKKLIQCTLVLLTCINPIASGDVDFDKQFLEQSLTSLKSRTELSDSFWQWLEEHEDVQTGLLVVQSPTPVQYVHNLAYLKSTIAPELASKYANLLLAVSLQETDIETSVAESRLPKAQKELSKNATLVVEYLKAHDLSLSALAVDPNEVLTELGIAIPKRKNGLNALWNEVALEIGTFPPPQRSDLVQSLEWLIQLHETPQSEVSGKWPTFPLAEAPWPLLLPLKQVVAPNESAWIWERYAEEGVFKTYGKYTWDYEKPEIRWKDSPYPPNSLQRITEDGGVCGRLSVLAQISYVSIGQPAMGMYQPGHRAFACYKGGLDGKPFTTKLGQSITGLAKSTSNWHLPNSSVLRFGKRCGIEHHIGLSLSMNVGLNRWHAGRIALLKARGLSETEVDAKIAILEEAMQVSPYDVELIYELASLIGGDQQRALSLIEQVRTFMGSPDVVVHANELTADTDFNEYTPTPMPPNKYLNQLVSQVCSVIKHNAGIIEQ